MQYYIFTTLVAFHFDFVQRSFSVLYSLYFCTNLHVGFCRCVQQDMEIGEAWSNMGAIYMRQKLYPQAHSALEQALKHKRDSWQVLENAMGCCLALGR